MHDWVVTTDLSFNFIFVYLEIECVAAILNNLTPEKLMEKLREMGLISKVGSEGRIYPYTEMANSVLDILRIKMKSLGIMEKCNQEVKKIVYNEGSYFIETTRGFQIPADYIVIATGGKAAPILGSNGSGYGLVKPFSSAGNAVTYFHCSIISS